jgi:hypothetical protein
LAKGVHSPGHDAEAKDVHPPAAPLQVAKSPVVAQSAMLGSDVVAVNKELGEGKDLIMFL